jgi:hypothetical protein
MDHLDYKIAEAIVDYNPKTRDIVRAVLGKLTPHDCANVGKTRYGKLNDGGYVMSDDFEGVTTVFSLGIDDDVSWDLDMANKGLKIFQYDHTIDQVPAIHPNFTWEKTGISSDDSLEGYKTLTKVVEENSNCEDNDLILKCDIEGHEWPVIASCHSALLARFRQIVIEIHAMNALANSKHANLIRQAITNLTTYHHVVHVHANNHAPWAILGSIPVPTVLELTLLRKDRGNFVPSTSEFPTPIDMPCWSNAADYPLGRFKF